MTVADVMPRVEKGAAWLDSVQPDWFTTVNVRAIDMADCARCVLGQAFGDYFNAVARFAPPLRHSTPNHWAVERGFALDSRDMDPSEVHQHWQPIREAWITVILERQFQAQDHPVSPHPVPVEA